MIRILDNTLCPLCKDLISVSEDKQRIVLDLENLPKAKVVMWCHVRCWVNKNYRELTEQEKLAVETMDATKLSVQISNVLVKEKA